MSEKIELWIMRIAVFVIGGIAYLLAIFGSEGLIQLLLGAYGPIAQLAPGVYAALFFKRASKNGVILGLMTGVVTTIYFQYFSANTIYDLHPGLIGLVINIFIVSLVEPVLFRYSFYTNLALCALFFGFCIKAVKTIK